MTLVDPFLLVITLVMTILIVIANIYFVAHYSHYADKAFASSTFCKVLVVSHSSAITYSLIALVDYWLHNCGKLNAHTSPRCW